MTTTTTTTCGFGSCTRTATGYAPWYVTSGQIIERRSACDDHGSDGALRPGEDSQVSSPEADRLMAEVEVLAGSLAVMISDGELPRGLYGNEARLGRIVLALRQASEVAGLEVDPTPVRPDTIAGKDLGWIVSAAEVPADRVTDVREAVRAAIDQALADLALQGLAVYADPTR